MTYSEKLKDPRWQKKRLEIFQRDGFTCQYCDDPDSQLQVHHKFYVYGKDPWEYENSTLTTLCGSCHENITMLKKEVKSIIDLDFDNIDYLGEIHSILTSLKKMRMCDIIELRRALNGKTRA